MYKFGGVLLESDDREKGELLIFGNFGRGAGYNLLGQGLVGMVELLDSHVGDGNKVGIEVFGVLDDEAGVYYGGKGFGGEVATGNSYQTLSVDKQGRGAYVRFRSAATRLVLVWLYWENLALTSLSMPAISCARCQIC